MSFKIDYLFAGSALIVNGASLNSAFNVTYVFTNGFYYFLTKSGSQPNKFWFTFIPDYQADVPSKFRITFGFHSEIDSNLY